MIVGNCRSNPEQHSKTKSKLKSSKVNFKMIWNSLSNVSCTTLYTAVRDSANIMCTVIWMLESLAYYIRIFCTAYFLRTWPFYWAYHVTSYWCCHVTLRVRLWLVTRPDTRPGLIIVTMVPCTQPSQINVTSKLRSMNVRDRQNS